MNSNNVAIIIPDIETGVSSKSKRQSQNVTLSEEELGKIKHESYLSGLRTGIGAMVGILGFTLLIAVAFIFI